MALATTPQGLPVLILKEGSKRTTGREALRTNILAAYAVAEVLKSSLGPRGLDKMLIDSFGDVTITNDGATIVKDMEVEHPAAKMLVEVSKAQDAEVGDGTTTAVVLAGELLNRANVLLDDNVHPSIIIDGYRKAYTKSIELLSSLAKTVEGNNFEVLKEIAKTALASKIVSGGASLDALSEISVKAVLQVKEQLDGEVKIDLDNVKIEKRKGESTVKAEIINGIVIDKEVVHAGMPKRVEKAKIALLNAPLEIEKTEITAKISITSPDQMKAFIDQETNILRDMVEKLASVGANVVICQKGIDDVAQHFLAKHKILAVRRVKQSDMEKLSRATGARIVTTIEDLTAEDLGYAELVEERRVANEKMLFVEGCKNPRSVSVLIRAGLERSADEIERSLHDALKAVATAVMDARILPGAGATHVEIAKAVREYAAKVGGREQLAVESFADAIEIIPKALAENAGLDPINVITELRAIHSKNGKYFGVDLTTGKPVDALANGIIEPATLSIQAVRSAVEAASAIIRIDDMVAAAKSTSAGKGKSESKSESSEESKD
jgi:thermosome